MKLCTICKEIKDDDQFYFNKYLSKFTTACKKCTNRKRREKYKTSGEQERIKNKEKKYTVRGRYCRLREDTKKRNIIASITEEQYANLISQPCYYCNNILGTKVVCGVGLDRINNNIGYELNNVLPCCNFCNTVKNYLLSPEEMKTVAQLLISLRKNSPPVNSINLLKTLTKSRKHPLKS